MTPDDAAGRAGLPSARTRAAISRRLSAVTGQISTATMAEMEARHSWFGALSANARSQVGLVAQSGIDGFVQWFRDPSQFTSAVIFGAAPRGLTRQVTLHQTVELVRTTIDVVETQIQQLMPRGDRQALQHAIVRYSREVAFAAAEVYARAAEIRGTWDARMEALVVDAVIRGETDETVLSRASTMGWSSDNPLTVVMGTAPESNPIVVADELRRRARKKGMDVLAALHGDRLVVVLGSPDFDSEHHAVERIAELADHFDPGPVVVGPVVEHLMEANRSARSALAGIRAAVAWPDAPRPVGASDLFPERALNGDGHARRALAQRVHAPLVAAGNNLLETLTSFFAHGSSIEATARELFVHANTVRYRLRRIQDETGYSPTDARDAYALRLGLTLGPLLGPL
ncbi:PucR family transcriptional regulator [Enemella sp. A6]|uniref:PucR family transcriptional regulator n=1 Tax=Enemella sp. A6 TaxID=3440152 RepID=UPI003EBD5C5C